MESTIRPQSSGGRRRRRTSPNIPRSLQCTDPGLSQYYYSRKSSRQITTNDLPLEIDAIGFYSPWAVFWYACFMVAPLAYIYILLMLLRDLCQYFPEAIHRPLQHYVPYLASLADMMNNASWWMDAWCVIEALFFISCALKIKYLQRKDPLEASLSAAPMMEPEDRKILWDRIMECEQDDPMQWISGWFFDEPVEVISRYDARDFLCWSMFDGRNQEHLTTEELHELEGMMEELEYRISLKLYGVKGDGDEKEVCNKENHDNDCRVAPEQLTPRKSAHRMHDDTFSTGSEPTGPSSLWLPRPKQVFRFSVDSPHEEPALFSNLYESYKDRYEKYKTMMETVEFHPVKDFRNILAETAHKAAETAHKAEESAMATAHLMYESIVQPGSNMDKQLSFLSHATSSQLSEAWNSVKGMKERIETATFLSAQRQSLMQQLKGNRAMLTRMREMSYAVPSKQMAALMRRITECYDALEGVEHRAREGFAHATGVLADKRNAFLSRKDPRRFAKYSSDPLLGIATYPLGLHLCALGVFEIALRVLMKKRGFERRTVGPVSYYFHPGTSDAEVVDESGHPEKVPIVFVHGIGIGILVYVPFIDLMLKTGRPIFLPEIPYVTAFRPWQSTNSVLSPAVVSSTMTAMLAIHGFERGVFAGHSYGTSWLSYVCKFAPNVVAALLFLDPICFCLHYARLTKNFVYHYPDPATISFIVRTDMMVNYTIQRAFPWSWISLFVESVLVPCTVFLSDKDALVPVGKVRSYFQQKNIPTCDAASVDPKFFDESDFNACVFHGQVHGGFTEEPQLLPPIAAACDSLCRKVEDRQIGSR